MEATSTRGLVYEEEEGAAEQPSAEKSEKKVKITLVIYDPPQAEEPAYIKPAPAPRDNNAMSKACACFVLVGAIAWGAASLTLRNLPANPPEVGIDMGAILHGAMNASRGPGRRSACTANDIEQTDHHQPGMSQSQTVG